VGFISAPINDFLRPLAPDKIHQYLKSGVQKNLVPV
jgi:hypothetical protein